MNRNTVERMRAATAAQAVAIRKQPCYEAVSREFSVEYEIARELADARRDAGLSQGEIAALMGTTQSVVSRIESGANVSMETVARYAAACGRRLEVRIR
jgi:ribosome-binding protein aMBF1 (putative translation factor)